VNDRETNPSLENRSVGLLKADHLAASNAKRLEDDGRGPRQLRPGVDQDITKQSPLPFSQQRLDSTSVRRMPMSSAMVPPGVATITTNSSRAESGKPRTQPEGRRTKRKLAALRGLDTA
jgi:hypothetical protein